MSQHDLFRRVTDILKSRGFKPVRSHGGHIWFQKDNHGVNVSHGMRDRNLAKQVLKNAGILNIRL